MVICFLHIFSCLHFKYSFLLNYRAILSKNAPIPGNEVIYDRENNTKMVISYESDDGEIYKETREYKIQKIRVPKDVAKRKAWKKFGDSAKDPPGPNPAYTYPGEVVKIQYLTNKLVSMVVFFTDGI